MIVLNSGSRLSEQFQERSKTTSYLCYGLVFAFVFVIVFFSVGLWTCSVHAIVFVFNQYVILHLMCSSSV